MSSSTASRVVADSQMVPARPGVLVRLRVRERRQEPDVEFGADAFDGGGRHAIGDQQVGVERQVRAVLLDGAERLHEDARGRDQLGRPRAHAVRPAFAKQKTHRNVTPPTPNCGRLSAVSATETHLDSRPRLQPTSTRSSSAPATTVWSPPPTWPGPGSARCCSRLAPPSVAPPPASRFAGATVNICNCDHLTFRTTPVIDELGLVALGLDYIDVEPAQNNYSWVSAADGRGWSHHHDLDATLDDLGAGLPVAGRRVPPLRARRRCRQSG